MSYKVVITDNNGHKVFTKDVDADDLLTAGIKAEDILEQFHREHPCKNQNCKHNCRVCSDLKKGDT